MSAPTIAIPGAQARETARSWAIRSGWLALGVTAILAGLAGAIGGLPRSYQYAPLLVSVGLLGLPHGAVDHLVIARWRDERPDRRWFGIVAGIYLVVGGLYAVVWFLAPVMAFVAFILMTWYHWGEGELYPLRDFVGVDYLDRRDTQALTILVRGGAPMLVPLIAFPEEYAFVAETLVGLFDAGAAAALEPAFSLEARLAVGVVYAASALGALGLGYRRTDAIEAWRTDAAEIAVLTGFFLVVPPILAIGIYFCFWHSLRHVARTVLLHDRSATAVGRGEVLGPARRFARDAAPLTVASIALLGGLYAAVPTSPTAVPDIVGLYLVLIAVLTLPHVVVVTWLDREQGVL